MFSFETLLTVQKNKNVPRLEFLIASTIEHHSAHRDLEIHWLKDGILPRRSANQEVQFNRIERVKYPRLRWNCNCQYNVKKVEILWIFCTEIMCFWGLIHISCRALLLFLSLRYTCRSFSTLMLFLCRKSNSLSIAVLIVWFVGDVCHKENFEKIGTFRICLEVNQVLHFNHVV